MIDVGTGDGRAVLALAAAEPTTLVLGLDADAASMVEASRRVARPAGRGGRQNAMFLVAAAEALPDELSSVAGRVSVVLPWGSLLRGCLGGDPSIAAGLARLLTPDGALELLLAPAARDHLADLPIGLAAIRAAVGAAFESSGLRIVEARLADGEDFRASGSSWAKRLLSNSSADRVAVLIRLRAS